jgi:tripartite-type tricarboxylate transporter receptor subunit TctC
MTKLFRCAVVFGAAAISVSSPAAAQQYPQKPIRIIVAFGAGGGTDIVARIIGQAMQERLGQPVTIENRPGAAGTIGNELVARADKDGYTLGIMVAGHAVAAAMRKQLRYDTLGDFDPIALMATQTLVIATRPDFKAGTVADLIKSAQAEPGKFSYASAGFGAVQHMAAELFSQSAKVKMVHVPFRTSPDAISAVLGGQVQVIFDTTAAVLGQLQSNELKPLAVTGKERLASLPKVPTVIESGIAGYDVATWYGMFGPKGMPQPVVEKLNKAILDSLKDKSVAERMDKIGFEVGGSSPQAFGTFLAAELKRWNDVRVAAGIEQVAN